MEVAPFPNRRTNAGRYCSSPRLAREVNKIVNGRRKLQTSASDLALRLVGIGPSYLKFVIPSEARNLLLADSVGDAGGQQVPQRLKPFRNDKIAVVLKIEISPALPENIR
jgi:hypothetical protein